MAVDLATDVARPKPERELENVGQDRPVLLYPRREGPRVVNVKFYCIIKLQKAGVEPRTPMTGVVDPSNGVSFRASDPGKAH